MGIYATEFYFKKELPKVDAIKRKFKEITGIRLEYKPGLELNELATDSNDIINFLNSPESAILGYTLFSCEGFSIVRLGEYMIPNSKSFYLECGITIKNMYFFHALSKTMLELGGHIIKPESYRDEEDLEIDKYLEPYNPYERWWKRIKKWEDMNNVERAAFKGKYAQ